MAAPKPFPTRYGGPSGDQILVKFSPISAASIVRKPANTPEAGDEDGKVINTFNFYKTDSPLVRSMLLAHGFLKEPEGGQLWTFQWSQVHVNTVLLRTLSPWQRVNHFPRAFELTKKNRMAGNLKKAKKRHGGELYGFFPDTFCLPAQAAELRVAFENAGSVQGSYIVKPSALSRGRGIYVLRSLDQIKEDAQVVVCRYIRNPLLINGLKFDLRLYVMVTSYTPLRVYIHERGLTRFATEHYDPSDEFLDNTYMHLTNYSINKFNKGAFARPSAASKSGSKWSLSDLYDHLSSEGVDVQELKRRIDQLVVHTMMAVEEPIGNAVREFVPHPLNCFEIYGVDVLIDEDLKPWLLEVNLTPSLASSSTLDHMVKKEVCSDMMNLAAFFPRSPPDPTSVEPSPASDADFLRAADELSPPLRDLARLTKEEWLRKGSFRVLYPAEDAESYHHLVKEGSTGIYPTEVLDCLFPA